MSKYGGIPVQPEGGSKFGGVPVDAPASNTDWMLNYDPTQDMSGFEKFAAGAGKGIVDIGRGIGQLFGITDEDAIEQSRELDAPLMETGAGLGGNVAGQILAALGGGSALRGLGAAGQALGAMRAGRTLSGAGTALTAPSSYKAAIGSGAALGAVQPTVGDESRLQNLALGGAAGAGGQLLANVAGKIIRPTAGLSETDKALAQSLEQKGVSLDALDLTESKPLKTLESVFENIPFTAGKATERATNRMKSYTRAALRTMGEDADEVTPELLESASKRIGSRFNELVQDTPINADAQFFADIKAIIGSAEKLPKSLQPKGSKGALNDLLGMEKFLQAGQQPQITPETYQLIRSALSKKALGMKMNNPQGAAEIGKVQSALDSLVERNLGGDKLTAWKDARRQWRNFKILEKAADSNQQVLSSGMFRPNDLARASRSVGKEKVVRGKSELAQLAREGAKFANVTPDSGTAQRMMLQGLVTGGLGGLGLGAGVDPALLAAGIASPMALQRALYSPAARSYLTGAAADAIPPALGQAGRTALVRGSVPLLGVADD